MDHQTLLAAIRSRLRRYRSRQVLTVWAALTMLLAGAVYVTVVPGYSIRLEPIPVPVTYAGLVVGGVVTAVTVLGRANRRLHLLGAAACLGVAAVSVPLGCTGILCRGPQRLHAFAEWTILGPAVGVTHAADGCVYHCPYTVELVPLVVGYLLLAESLPGSGE